MTQNNTIAKLAEQMRMTPQKLLEQLSAAGMSFGSADETISSAQKAQLLGHLKKQHGTGGDAGASADKPRGKIMLKRGGGDAGGNVKSVSTGRNGPNVEVRVKRKIELPGKSGMTEAQRHDAERSDALRKLEESRRRNEEEQRQLEEQDQRRREEREQAERAAKEAAEEAARLEAERKVQAAAAAKEDDTSRREKPAASAPVRRTEAPARPGAPPARRPAGDDRLHLRGDREQRQRGRSAGPARGRDARGAGGRRRPEQSRTAAGPNAFQQPTTPIVREVAIGETISVAELAQKLALKGGEVVKALMKMGVMVTVTQTIDYDTAALVTEELGHIPVQADATTVEDELIAHMKAGDQGDAIARPPVVTIMGHVDHGKTSLLDYIRRTKVVSGEAGGITQHIGAYHVETDRGVISFLDTPGHAAFSQMRARGAQLTDIVVLVVAADDGVKPQTKEAIQHAKAANVPLIVAVNKIDKSDADPARIKSELLAEDVVAEEYGGDTQFVEISAKQGTNIDDLLDAISLQAEVLELTAVREGRASGVVIESSLDKGRGPVATVLVREGTLKRGDYLVCGVMYGRVRALTDESGQQVAEATPSIPVQVLGLSGVPDAGDDFVVVDDERLAKDVAQQRDAKRRESRLAKSSNRMEDILAQMGSADQQQLNLVVKADVQGSVQALREALTSLSTDAIRINVIGSGVGGITESDATLAATSKATIIGFNVRADASARKVIETNGIDLRYFSIIYDVIDQVKQVASGLLGMEIREEIIGIAEVRDVFRSSKFGAVAGCMVVEGSVKSSKPIRVLRDNTVVFEGELESLRRFKENVDEVKSGTECGIGVKAYNDIKPGDQIECFERIEIARTL